MCDSYPASTIAEPNAVDGSVVTDYSSAELADFAST